MPKSRSNNSQPKPSPSSWPAGVKVQDVIDWESEIRQKAEADLERRIKQLEDRMCIVESCENFQEAYPELKAAYDKFREEEAKMLTFEALKKDK